MDIEVSDEELTSTSFVLSWSSPPPEDHNGLIRHYVVRCTELETGAVFQHLAVNVTERVVDTLHPFYSYSCTIAAVTVAEGPFSSSVTVATEQDGIVHAMIKIHCFYMHIYTHSSYFSTYWSECHVSVI